MRRFLQHCFGKASLSQQQDAATAITWKYRVVSPPMRASGDEYARHRRFSLPPVDQ